MSSEESNKMSPKTPSQDLNFSLEDCKKAIIDAADEYDKLLERAGQNEQPAGSAEAMWEMEKKMWKQREQEQ